MVRPRVTSRKIVSVFGVHNLISVEKVLTIRQRRSPPTSTSAQETSAAVEQLDWRLLISKMVTQHWFFEDCCRIVTVLQKREVDSRNSTFSGKNTSGKCCDVHYIVLILHRQIFFRLVHWKKRVRETYFKNEEDVIMYGSYIPNVSKKNILNIFEMLFSSCYTAGTNMHTFKWCKLCGKMNMCHKQSIYFSLFGKCLYLIY